ncbi:MAG: nucleotidyltransferase domain-containing protein [Methanobacteriota archaeon]|nr:MAG: nucleotidyltransferase domain-containing protein [Euryarchaeota archaeon]
MDSGENRIDRFIERVKKRFTLGKIILFGSRARGDNLKDSDYDIMIISPTFEGLNFRERIIEVYSLVEEPLNVEVICLTPEEFKARKEELGIVGVAAREGRVIA